MAAFPSQTRSNYHCWQILHRKPQHAEFYFAQFNPSRVADCTRSSSVEQARDPDIGMDKKEQSKAVG
jgi:3-methyladenine DNA glycosylase Tag